MDQGNIARVKDLLEQRLESAQVEIADMTGTDDHLDLTVTSSEFEGLPLLKQHQKVMGILREVLADKVHAVQIKTRTPATPTK